jgi:aminoglycoside phosphotransferase family enzyme/predicted kinase
VDARAVLVEWLRRRSPEPVQVLETHISVVAFQDDRVYKARKDVRFPFVDLSTAALREADCIREVVLNRRFAPDVYIDVLPVTDAAGTVVDHVVEMRRLPDERRLAALARDGHDIGGCLDRLANDLAVIHANAATGGEIDAAATARAVSELWELGIEQTTPYENVVVPAGTAQCVARLARAYISGRDALFESRVANGRARDGHGDLLAQDIFCLEGGPRAIDCLEFDDDLRYGDVLADVAFLAMDLEHLGRADLATSFLCAYRRASGDDWPSSLEDMYLAYRAHVRAKVACLRHGQGDEQAPGEARALLALAHRHLERGRIRLVLVGGPPASGKSTLAGAIARETGWPVLRSDVVRKQLAGLAPRTHAGAALDEGIYTSRATDDTYSALLAKARAGLELGSSVIIDASWADESHRALARLVATETSSELVELQCDAPRAVRTARAAERATTRTDASDAGPELVGVLGERFTAWPSARKIDTTSASDAVAAETTALLLAPSCGVVS